MVKIRHAPIGPATGSGLQTEPHVLRGSDLCSWVDEAVDSREMGRPLFYSWEFVFPKGGKQDMSLITSLLVPTSSLSMVLVSSASSGTLSEIQILGFHHRPRV